MAANVSGLIGCAAVNIFRHGISCPPLVCRTRDSLSERGDVKGGQATVDTSAGQRTTVVSSTRCIQRVGRHGSQDFTSQVCRPNDPAFGVVVKPVALATLTLPLGLNSLAAQGGYFG